MTRVSCPSSEFAEPVDDREDMEPESDEPSERVEAAECDECDEWDEWEEVSEFTEISEGASLREFPGELGRRGSQTSVLIWVLEGPKRGDMGDGEEEGELLPERMTLDDR
jgi:hypothetical protein